MCPPPPETSEPLPARRSDDHTRPATDDAPVFVDRTGRRGRRVTGLGALVTVPALAFAGTLALSAVNSPPVDRPPLPAQGPRTPSVRGHVENAAKVGAREPGDRDRGNRRSVSRAEVSPALAPANDRHPGRP